MCVLGIHPVYTACNSLTERTCHLPTLGQAGTGTLPCLPPPWPSSSPTCLVPQTDHSILLLLTSPFLPLSHEFLFHSSFYHPNNRLILTFWDGEGEEEKKKRDGQGQARRQAGRQATRLVGMVWHLWAGRQEVFGEKDILFCGLLAQTGRRQEDRTENFCPHAATKPSSFVRIDGTRLLIYPHLLLPLCLVQPLVMDGMGRFCLTFSRLSLISPILERLCLLSSYGQAGK